MLVLEWKEGKYFFKYMLHFIGHFNYNYCNIAKEHRYKAKEKPDNLISMFKSEIITCKKNIAICEAWFLVSQYHSMVPSH
jgi:hypothetical protein